MSTQKNKLAGFGPNEWLVEEMYQQYLADPTSVDAAWHEFFDDYRTAPGTSSDGGTVPASRPAGGNGAVPAATAPERRLPTSPSPPPLDRQLPRQLPRRPHAR